MKGANLRPMYANLRGPARLLAVCATILLVSSALLGVEAGIMIILGPARDIVAKPFLLLGYLEGCAMLFSTLGIVAAIIGLIFYRPYRYISDQIYLYRARRAPQVSDRHTYFEDVRPMSPAPTSDSKENGVPAGTRKT
jgi:hypothetical protein